MPTLTALYDACVLYPAPLRDLLMNLALTNLFRARWTDLIQEEWTRNLLANRLSTDARTGRYPFCAQIVWADGDHSQFTKACAAATWEPPEVTAIGVWMRMSCLGTMYWIASPAFFAESASLS